MNTTCDFLDALRVRYGISSDYALAKFLQCTQSSVTHYRHKRSALSDEMALKVADLLDLPRAEVYLSIQAERAAKQQNGPVFDALTDALRRLGGIAAAALLFVALASPESSIASVIFSSDYPATAEMRLAFDNNTDYRKWANLQAAWLSGFLFFRFWFMICRAFRAVISDLGAILRAVSRFRVIRFTTACS